MNPTIVTDYKPPLGWGLKSVEEQIEAYRLFWPQLNNCSAESLLARYTKTNDYARNYRTCPEPTPVLPERAEGLIVIPKTKALTRLVGFSFRRRNEPYYNRILRMILMTMYEDRPDFTISPLPYGNVLSLDDFTSPSNEYLHILS